MVSGGTAVQAGIDRRAACAVASIAFTAMVVLLILIAPDGAYAQICVGTAGPCFQSLGFLNAQAPTPTSVVNGISPDGSVVVGYSTDANGFTQAFSWSGGVMTGLGFLIPSCMSDCSSAAVAVNGTMVVGESTDVNGNTGVFVTTANGALQAIAYNCHAGGLASGTAVAVGNCVNSFGHVEAVSFSNGIIGLGFLDLNNPASSAFGVNATGSVIVGQSRYDAAGDVEAFICVVSACASSGMSGLGFLYATAPVSSASAVNADGSIVVGASQNLARNGYEAVRWVNGAIADLGPGSSGGVSADGNVVVGQTAAGSAFRWTPSDGMQSILSLLTAAGVNMPSGWHLTAASAISADGTMIAGTGNDPNGNLQGWIARLASPLVAAVLPESRSVQVNATATAFATIINTGTTTASGCSIAPAGSLPATFAYQTTNPQTNVPSGTANTPVNIAAGALQSFVIALTPSAPFSPTNVAFNFACSGMPPAPVINGLNTLLLSASTSPTPDVVALAATMQNDGIVHVTGTPMQGAFAVATIDLGAGGPITVAANTGAATLAITITMCQTNPQSGQCLQSPAAMVTTTINTNATPTFAIFVTATGTVQFDPANSRVFVQFIDSGNAVRGETSVAVETQ